MLNPESVWKEIEAHAFAGPGHSLTPSDVGMLLRYSEGASHAVDLGCFKGASAIVMAKNAKFVATIGCFERIDLVEDKKSQELYKELFKKQPHYYEDVKESLKAYENIRVFPGLTYINFTGVNPDVLFIDGDHSYKGVKMDFEGWFPDVKKGGYILFHDYQRDDWGVKRFVEEEILPRSDMKVAGKASVTIAFEKLS